MPETTTPTSPSWQFAIDVGGTFTDCIGVDPQGRLHAFKTLSSGRTKGRITEVRPDNSWFDPARKNDPDQFWSGAKIEFQNDGSATVAGNSGGWLWLSNSDPVPKIETGWNYELTTGEEAPVLGIRYLLGLPPGSPFPPANVRLGTTRGTNALLERKGARVALITTQGFEDILRIGDQARPKLFELAINKPSPLFRQTLGVAERIAADGQVLLPLATHDLPQQLMALRSQGIESLAVAFLHAYRNPEHEQAVEAIARAVGFDEVVASSAVSPTIKIVPRAESAVLDAYLNPVLRQYVRRIEHQLNATSHKSADKDSAAPAVSLQLMTSAGGLVDAGRFTGRDSILSGPAGGVVGSSQTARQAGFLHSIGFDMGGTSTDVSRFDGQVELEYESRKAGVRIASPMLAIETVAAGGGSICDFDGVKLVVGPASAGSDPGPACYGRGGPLTVTDCNLFLGRLAASQFPFPLDRTAVQIRLEQLAARIRESSEWNRSLEELAAGLLEIADTHMARAIRRISVSRGYDPADYALSVFGGAGAQHACALAELLGIHQIVIHPLAGVLSAFGIACADTYALRSRTVLKPLSELGAGEIQQTFDELEADAIRELAAPPGSAHRLRSLELRYVGLESPLTIPEPADGDYLTAYEQAHLREFGYLRAGRPMEVVTIRLAIRAGNSALPTAAVPARWKKVELPATRVFLNGEWVLCDQYLRDEMGTVSTVVGPALLAESSTTVLLQAGFEACMSAEGTLLITRRKSDRAQRNETSLTVDPIRLEIFNSLFASIAEQMGETLRRTSVSTNVKERLDYSCAVFDAAGELIVNAPHIPVHLGAMGETVKTVLMDNPDLVPGDVVLTNDPFRGGSHLPDLTVVTPVFDAAGTQLQFVVASRAHHAEIGGIVPGSMPPFSRTLADEGVLIRNFRVIRQGEFQEAELRRILAGVPPLQPGSRRPDDNVADIVAQIAANRTGVNLLQQLIEDQTWDVVRSYMGFIRDAASAKVQQALASLPNREFSHTDWLDDGSPISVRITVDGKRAIVDFAGTGSVLSSNLNANRAIVTAAVMYVFRLLINEDIPLNGGVLDPIEIRIPESLLSPPAHEDPSKCAAIVGGNVETSQRVVDVLLAAFGLAAASQGTMNNLTFGDRSFGYYETICGGSGATPVADGASAVHTHMTNTRLTDAELLEHRYPVRLTRFEVRQGSGGAGQHRGGDGIIREIEFLAPLTVSILSQRRGPYPPPGLDGGRSGLLGRNLLLRADATVDLGAAAQIEVGPGDRLRIETPGGGGYGAIDQT